MSADGTPFGFRKPDPSRYTDLDFADPEDPDPPSEELTMEQWQDATRKIKTDGE